MCDADQATHRGHWDSSPRGDCKLPNKGPGRSLLLAYPFILRPK